MRNSMKTFRVPHSFHLETVFSVNQTAIISGFPMIHEVG